MHFNSKNQGASLLAPEPSHRMEKVNSNIKTVFSEILIREADLPNNVLVTVSDVETTKNLSTAIVWLSILPNKKASRIMRLLKPQLYDLQGTLNRELNMKPLPRIKLKVDHGPEHASKIEHTLRNLE